MNTPWVGQVRSSRDHHKAEPPVSGDIYESEIADEKRLRGEGQPRDLSGSKTAKPPLSLSLPRVKLFGGGRSDGRWC